MIQNPIPRILTTNFLRASPFFLICWLAACSKDSVTPTPMTLLTKPPKTIIESVAISPLPPEPEPKAGKPRINGDPNQLLGLSPSGVSDRLGPPNFVRRDAAAEIWQYLADACILDIFLYREGRVFTVDYVELRGRGGAKLSRFNCLVEMLRAQLDTKSD